MTGLLSLLWYSLLFELLGSAVAVALFKIVKSNGAYDSMSQFINTDSAMLIIAGIFLSVIVAFTVGLLIMALVRFMFSFNVMKSYKYWGGIWGGIAVTSILYFLLIKGAKGSTLISPETLDYLKNNTFKILAISFVGWTIILQFFVTFTRINILKLTVLIGTFALAMAFAGNDLVNFIGVPLAGFESFKAFSASGASPDSFMMDALSQKVDTPLFFLIIAGLIMVITLRLSKKAKSVTATTIDLSRQGEGSERFASSGLARFLVRRSVNVSNGVSRITPKALRSFVGNRFDSSKSSEEEGMAFDLVRASVNLVVASILIAIGTSLKLPLSTTYVTFMVAMGTSLADGAWGRESAVYRITGVLTVVGGWFFTALVAFTVSFLIATLIFFGKLPVILALIAISIFILIRTHALHKKRNEEKEDVYEVTASSEILDHCESEVNSALLQVSKLLLLTYTNFSKEDHKELKNIKKQVKKLNNKVKDIKESVPQTLQKFQENEIISGHHYVQIIDYLKEVTNALSHIINPAFSHIDNNHALDNEQSKEMKVFTESMIEFLNYSISLLKNRNEDDMKEYLAKRDLLLESINEIIRNRIKILKKTQKGTKVSMTYIEMLTESKNLLLHVVHLVKADHEMAQSLENQEV
jgi:hypothetical protein